MSVFQFFSVSAFFMNLIVGLNAFHPDSSACVLKDGKLLAAVAEERLLASLDMFCQRVNLTA